MSRKIKASKGQKAKADKLFSIWVRSIGECEHCFSRQNLQCAHIRSRRFNRWRCDPRNAVCLCAGCHHYFTDHPVEFVDWVRLDPDRDMHYADIQLEDTERVWKTPSDWWEQKIIEIESWPKRTA